MKEQKLEALYNQFIAIRGVVDTALILLHEELYEQEPEQDQDQEDPDPENECKHKNVKSFTTLGGPVKWVCRDCGFEYDESKGRDDE